MAARKTSSRRDECVWGHAMTPENTYVWTNRAGYVTHQCRTCRDLLNAARRDRRRWERRQNWRDGND